MKKLMEIIRGARKIEIFAALVAIAILLMQLTGVSGNLGGVPQTELERRLSQILSEIDGAGTVRVMVADEAQGVLVVADGASNIRVCLKIQYAVHTLLGTDISRIEVVQRDG